MGSLHEMLSQKKAQKDEEARILAEAEAAAAAETERQAQEAARAEQMRVENEANNEQRNEVDSLRKQINSLKMIKGSFEVESERSVSAATESAEAEGTIDDMVETFKDLGHTKEELIADPDAAEHDEVVRVKAARADNEFLAGTAKVLGSEEVIARLKELGITVGAETSRADIEAAIDRRVAELEPQYQEKFMALPGAKEKLVAEVLTREKFTDAEGLKQFDRIVSNGREVTLNEATVGDAYRRFQYLLKEVQEFKENPGLKIIAMGRIALDIAEGYVRTQIEAKDRAYETVRYAKAYNADIEQQAAEAGMTLEQYFAVHASDKSAYENHAQYLNRIQEKIEGPSKRLMAYAELQAQLHEHEYGKAPTTLNEQWASIKEASAKFIGLPDEEPLDLDMELLEQNANVGFRLPEAKAKAEQYKATNAGLEAQIDAIRTQDRELGGRPSPGLFGGGNVRKWEEAVARNRDAIAAKQTQIDANVRAARGINTYISLGRLAYEIGDELKKNPRTKVGAVKLILSEAFKAASAARDTAENLEERNRSIQRDLERNGQSSMRQSV